MAAVYLRARPGHRVPAHPSLAADSRPSSAREWARHLANWVNLSTPLGLAVARMGGARIRPGPSASYLADYYRWTFPAAGAFTIGDVIVTRHDLDLLLARNPELLGHELKHSGQWALCLGLPFLPLYVAAMGWSWIRTGDRASGNIFERRAGLLAGGYRPHQQGVSDQRT